jgi:hypothetical protein
MAEPIATPTPATPLRMFRRLDPSEIPPELADDDLLRYLTTITPEDERIFDRLAELDARDP